MKHQKIYGYLLTALLLIYAFAAKSQNSATLYATGLIQHLNNEQAANPPLYKMESINAEFKVTTSYADAALQINKNLQTLIRAIRSHIPAGSIGQFVNPRVKTLAGYTSYYVTDTTIPYQIMFRPHATRVGYYYLLIYAKANY